VKQTYHFICIPIWKQKTTNGCMLKSSQLLPNHTYNVGKYNYVSYFFPQTLVTITFPIEENDIQSDFSANRLLNSQTVSAIFLLLHNHIKASIYLLGIGERKVRQMFVVQ
jgi:hypothetical protein